MKWFASGMLAAVASVTVLWMWVWLWNKKWCSDNKGWVVFFLLLFMGMWMCIGITRDAAKNLHAGPYLLQKEFEDASINWNWVKSIFDKAESSDEHGLFDELCRSIYDYERERNPLTLLKITQGYFKLPVGVNLRLNYIYRHREMKCGRECFEHKRKEIQNHVAVAIAERQRKDNMCLFTKYGKDLPIDRLLYLLLPLCALLIPVSVRDIKIISPQIR